MRLPFPHPAFLLGSALLLLSSCSKLCDTKDLPQHSLTAGQQAWSAPFPRNAVWRFRNGSGYERTYRITEAEMKNEGGGGGKSSFCPKYYTQYAYARMERTDSTGSGFESTYMMQLSAQNPDAGQPFRAYLQWGSANFQLPIDEVEDGRRTLPTATFAGRTYQGVLESTYAPLPPGSPRPNSAARLFLTKTEGVIRVEEYGGTVWTRIF